MDTIKYSPRYPLHMAQDETDGRAATAGTSEIEYCTGDGPLHAGHRKLPVMGERVSHTPGCYCAIPLMAGTAPESDYCPLCRAAPALLAALNLLLITGSEIWEPAEEAERWQEAWTAARAAIAAAAEGK
jgi:hypothetical protein